MTRKLYITDAMLERKGACKVVRDQINEVLGTRSRKVPVTYLTALAVEVCTRRINWAADYLLTPAQRAVYWSSAFARTAASCGASPRLQTTDYDRERRKAEAFVTAYYSPKR